MSTELDLGLLLPRPLRNIKCMTFRWLNPLRANSYKIRHHFRGRDSGVIIRINTVAKEIYFGKPFWLIKNPKKQFNPWAISARKSRLEAKGKRRRNN